MQAARQKRQIQCLPNRWIGSLAALFAMAGAELLGEEVHFTSCPVPVQSVILANLTGGKIDEIKRIEIENRVLYLVEIDLKNFKEIKLHITGSGVLQKSIEEIRPQDLPPAVRGAVDAILAGRGRIKDVERVVVEGRVEYHVEIGRPQLKDTKLVFDEAGTFLSQK